MASVHPIMDALREKRIKRGMTLSKLARVANLNRESIRKRETRKFPSLMVLDRWCRALGCKLTLIEIDPPHPNQHGRNR
jgi:transcriptional regulator with XRE-family HTH domain